MRSEVLVSDFDDDVDEVSRLKLSGNVVSEVRHVYVFVWCLTG